jgi:DNA-directed RNA polymerase specialized sigma24 family protein
VNPPETAFVARLRRYARALAGPGSAPDDLVRETLERAARAPQPYGEDRESRIALFTLMHQIYAQDTAPQPASDFDRAVGALPPEQREVFLLVTVEEMSYEDVARALGIPIGTVMSRLYRAREKLRALLLGRSRLKLVG